MHAILRFKNFSHGRRDNIAIFGDGNLGFITGIFLKSMLPDSKLTIFGVMMISWRAFHLQTTHITWQVN